MIFSNKNEIGVMITEREKAVVLTNEYVFKRIFG